MSVLTFGTSQTSRNNLPRLSSQALRHIPGNDGWSIIGDTFSILADPKDFVEKCARRYGLVHRTRAFGIRYMALLGPQANEFVLLDNEKLFSSTLGWDFALGRVFPRGLILLDFDEHRLHRRALSVAFKSGPMQSYLGQLNAGITKGLAQWPRGREFQFFLQSSG